MEVLDFTLLSDSEVLDFVDAKFELFATEKACGFPENVRSQLHRGRFAILRRKEGFAIAYKGRLHASGPGFVAADLMFLFVTPAFEGRGIGSQLVSEVKNAVTPGVPIVLSCEGNERMKFFNRCGFVVDVHHPVSEESTDDFYEMIFNPSVAAKA